MEVLNMDDMFLCEKSFSVQMTQLFLADWTIYM